MLELSSVYLFAEGFLPFGDILFQHSHLLHQSLELYIGLDLKTIIGHQLYLLLDEGEYADLLIGVQTPILVLIEDSHELPQ